MGYGRCSAGIEETGRPAGLWIAGRGHAVHAAHAMGHQARCRPVVSLVLGHAHAKRVYADAGRRFCRRRRAGMAVRETRMGDGRRACSGVAAGSRRRG